VTAALCLAAALTACTPRAWPLLARYVERWVSPDGRVVDASAGGRTVSEGQAYLLFFALVAGDDELFRRVLTWTSANLARGRLGEQLPAWLWGRDAGGRWRVLDDNAAADADLWLGYALVEAGRLWRSPEFDRLGRALVAQVALREVRELPGLGPALLPGPRGFEIDVGRAWRLNPSYLPVQLARGLAAEGVPGPWAALASTQVRLIAEASRGGYAPDWALWRGGRFREDPLTGVVASYDAIRVYLWDGMLSAEEPLRAFLLAATYGPARRLADRGDVPERVDLANGAARGRGPPAFAAALLPDALARGDGAAAARLSALVAGEDELGTRSQSYYDVNLALFARGFAERRFRFAADGRLAPEWEVRCHPR
jgi:endoglucanase